MFEPSDFISVQPENRSTLEEALEYAWQRLIIDAERPYPLLRQPLFCPEEFVVFLAGERGVFDYQPSDSLQQKRNSTHHAFEIHQKAGTRHGLKVALDVLDCDLEVTPWHKMEPPSNPYHIDVVAWRRDSPTNKEVLERVWARIAKTKSERDTVSLSLAFGVNSSLAFAGATSQIVFVDGAADVAMPAAPSCKGAICFAGATRMVLMTEMVLESV